jgi:hypothetical protein
MNRSIRPRTMSKLSESTHRRLNAYALAATAAGVGTLALVTPSEAKIVYTATHRVIKGGTSYKLDFNHNGVVDFTLSNAAGSLSVSPAAGNAVSGFNVDSGTRGYASALRRGALIGTRRYFPGRNMAWVGTTGDGGTVSGGSWVNVKNRYLGLKFKISAKAHYGWARLSVQVDDSERSITAVLTGYAYETIAHRPIKAGQTKEMPGAPALGSDSSNLKSQGPSSSVVNPVPGLASFGSLGRLARGIPGFAP